MKENAWVQTTVEQAVEAEFCSSTVSAKDKRFICDLCRHYVTLTKPGKQARHFRHGKTAEEKDCPEYKYGSSRNLTYSFEDRPLPIRLNLSSSTPFLEIGLLYIPEDILQAQAAQKVVIHTSQDEIFEYSFERLNPQSVTFLPIGSTPSPVYRIEAPQTLYSIWPKRFEGIKDPGCVFDSLNARKLPADSDTVVGNAYYILTKRKLRNIFIDIELKKLCPMGDWTVYEAKATQYSLSAANFFMEFECRLTERPLQILPLWPMHIEAPLAIKHHSDRVTIAVTGQRVGECELQPKASIKSIKTSDTGRAVIIDCRARDRYLSIGHSNVLQYLYLWNEPLEIPRIPLTVNVLDQSGKEIASGEHTSLPINGLILVTAPFDGKVVYRKHGVIIDQRKLSSGTQLAVDNITSGTEILIYQGNDIVWHAGFRRGKKTETGSDDALLRQLQSFHGHPTPVYHQLGAIASKLSGFPKVKAWIYASIRNGQADEQAIAFLNRFVLALSIRQKGDAI